MQVSLVEWCVFWLVIGYALSIFFSSDDDEDEPEGKLVKKKGK